MGRLGECDGSVGVCARGVELLLEGRPPKLRPPPECPPPKLPPECPPPPKLPLPLAIKITSLAIYK